MQLQQLGIETALEGVGDSFIEKYRLMKNRLLNVEYEHWAAGFAEGNNHGKGHITRVLENLDHLLGSKPLEHLGPYELFLAMMSILYHDIGLLRQRKGHEEISKTLLEGDIHDAYIINPIDKQIIAAAVVSHSSSKDIAQECSQFSQEEIIGKYRARPGVVAALVRLADELDEDFRRADPILQQRLRIPPESTFFWLFCQRVRGVRPNLISKRIDFNLALEPEDTRRYGPTPEGRIRHFVAFCAEKLAKINQERVTVNRFLPPELQYGGLHVDLKPLRDHSTWRSPRTFVFNDYTTAQMFLQSSPEILNDPANDAMREILKLMKKRHLDKAEAELNKLVSVTDDLPAQVQLRILYDLACVQSMRLADFPGNSPQRKNALDQGEKYLTEWFVRGQNGGFKAIGRTADAEVHDMAVDSDLAALRSERRSKLQKAIPKVHWPTPGGGGGGSSGCVPAGTNIDTPNGQCLVEDLQPGDAVISLKLDHVIERVRSAIVAVSSERSKCCILWNQIWYLTPSQPVRTSEGWVEARTIKTGDKVMDGYGMLVPIVEIDIVERSLEVFDLTVDNPCHNYVANGLLCHNKKG